MFPTEIYHYIVSKMDGFERENMRLVCKTFNEFKFIISSKNPARDREVLLIDCNKRFYELFEYGHLDIIKQCYKRYGNPKTILNYSCRAGFTDFMREFRGLRVSLSECCFSGNKDTIRMALGLGAWDFIAGLKILCLNGNLGLFNYLLDMSRHSPYMDDLLDEACSSGNIYMVKRVTEFPLLNEDIWNRGLASACKSGNMDIIQMMIEKGANQWNMAFYAACAGGNMEIVKFTIEMGATDIGCIGTACMGGHVHILKMLMEKTMITDENWEIGFHMAISYGHIEIVKLLSKDSLINDSLLKVTKMTSIEIMDYLIKRGAKVEEQLFMSIINHEDLDRIKFIIKNGGIVTDKIIERAEQVGDKRVIKYLMNF